MYPLVSTREQRLDTDYEMDMDRKMEMNMLILPCGQITQAFQFINQMNPLPVKKMYVEPVLDSSFLQL